MHCCCMIIFYLACAQITESLSAAAKLTKLVFDHISIACCLISMLIQDCVVSVRVPLFSHSKSQKKIADVNHYSALGKHDLKIRQLTHILEKQPLG